MDVLVGDILDALRGGGSLDQKGLDRIIRGRSAQAHDGRRLFAKKRILPFYLEARDAGGDTWRSWNVDDELDRAFVELMRMKPRRTASGVATITVLTKPWPCRNDCVYCPNDAAMPKSYLSDEPACQRAKRNRFHPFLQVASRLRTLERMGHETGKVELIVLGGTWLDYPSDYREWFVSELFRALDADADEREGALRAADEDGSLPSDECEGADLGRWQRTNELAAHRVVGLVFETRPDTVTPDALAEMRLAGCTKVQLGVQSLDDSILAANGRAEDRASIGAALGLCRLFGFKTHVHYMFNLLGATPEGDEEGYRELMTDPAFMPDEVKLYPCALVEGTRLAEFHRAGLWRPYTEQELVGALVQCMKATPGHARISRMIRDISAKDIIAGNKKTNLRQIVDEQLVAEGASIQEIRFREIGTKAAGPDGLALKVLSYRTASTEERFLQWVNADNAIFGFLRLSLPDPNAVEQAQGLPVGVHEAMIREVHVYGFATSVDSEGSSAQHRGLGRELVETACQQASEAGYKRINVISAVGTRDYYRKLGFADSGLYQQRALG